LAHQFWLLIWNTNKVNIYNEEEQGTIVPELGPLERWVDESREAWQKSEGAQIHIEDIELLQKKQKEIMQKKLIEEEETNVFLIMMKKVITNLLSFPLLLPMILQNKTKMNKSWKQLMSYNNK